MGSLDHTLFLFFNKTLHASWLDPFMVVLTDTKFLATLFASLMCFYLLKAEKKSTALLFIFFAVATYAIADFVPHRFLKPLFGRLRPSNPSYFINGVHQFLPGGHFLVGLKSSYSMPSIHSLTAFSQALFWGSLYPKLRLGLLITAGLIAYTRVYVGVHYPADILVGALFGSLLGFGMQKIAYKTGEKVQWIKEEK